MTHLFIARLLTDGKPKLGTEDAHYIRLKTWKGCAARLLKMRPPNHNAENVYRVEQYGGWCVGVRPVETRNIRVTLTHTRIGGAIYQG